MGTNISILLPPPPQANSHFPSPCLCSFHLPTPLSSRLFSLNPSQGREVPSPEPRPLEASAPATWMKERPQDLTQLRLGPSARLLNNKSARARQNPTGSSACFYSWLQECSEKSRGASRWKTDSQKHKCVHGPQQLLVQSGKRDPKAKIAFSKISLHTTSAASQLYPTHRPAHLYFRLPGRGCVSS